MIKDAISVQCPQCAAAFQIPPEIQLTGKEKLRCSQCHHIFLSKIALPDQVTLTSLESTSTMSTLPADPELQALMDLIEELESSLQIQEAPAPLPMELSKPIAIETITQTITTSPDETLIEKKISDISNSPQTTDAAPTTNLFAEYLNTLQTPPLETIHVPPKKPRRRLFNFSLFLGLSLLMSALWITGQNLISWDALSRIHQGYTILKTFCDLFSCSPPAPIEIQAIKSLKIVMRPDPQAPQKLLIDALIVNQADYPQPFPDLEIRLTDQQSQRIMQKRFHADEYRRGQLKKLTRMPPHQPMHILLTIKNPGNIIVNYEVLFHPAINPLSPP